MTSLRREFEVLREYVGKEVGALSKQIEELSRCLSGKKRKLPSSSESSDESDDETSEDSSEEMNNSDGGSSSSSSCEVFD